jgi:predicted Zn finger-like uncharacterized protein
MILTCPACDTRFNVNAAALGATGRTVRCARCAHTWHQSPPAGSVPLPTPPLPIAPFEPVTPPALVGGGQTTEARFAIDTALDGPMQRFQVPTPDVPRPKRRLSGIMLGWIGLAVFVGALVGGLVLFHDTIVDAWPPAARLYALFGTPVAPEPFAFEIRKTRGSDSVVNGHRTLVVFGEVANVSKKAHPAPTMRLTLYGVDKKPVSSTDFPVDHPPLQPGESTPFKYTLTDPPDTYVQPPIVTIVTQ